MALSKPYRRMIRPFTDGEYLPGGDDEPYVLSDLYAPDRSALIRAYSVIERDLVRLFDYVEPCDDNLNTYSYRAYELLLRAATEFETNCKAILTSNGYSSSDKLCIKDYHKINAASKLSDYKIILNQWLPGERIFEPFRDWAKCPKCHTLRWYQSYNMVKHDRGKEFSKANLCNVVMSVTGVLVILFSQFHVFALNPHQRVESHIVENGSIYVESSLFRVVPPSASAWSPDEQYEFDWNAIKTSGAPFDTFKF